MNIIGLMSGTSLDGIDAVLAEFSGTTESELQWSVKAFATLSFREEQRRQIHDAITRGTPADLCRLDADLGEWFAVAALAVCEAAGVSPEDVDFIGSHGQTVWHIPPDHGRRGATLQLGDPATIAERTGIPVVSDFRSRDMAVGGQGAPLVPWQDRVLFSLPGRRRVLQNIGGIGNLTWVPPRGEPAALVAFDTGPGNVLIDAAAEMATSGRETFDRDGHWAARGRVDESLLAEMLAHPYFDQPPPKSTGRELFGRPYLEAIVGRLLPGDEQWADLIATMTAFTARTISIGLRRWVAGRGVDEVVVSGGGARNPALMAMIRAELAPIPVLPGESLGVNPDAKEALAFAALAWAFANRIPANVPEATGASGLRVLGSYTPGGRGRRGGLPGLHASPTAS